MAHPWVDEGRPVYPGTVKEGYLVKSPPLDRKGVKHWRQRWCVFTSTGNNEPPCLLYFTDRQAVLKGRMPINRVTLERCFKIERSLRHSSHPHVFAVHLPERIFYFSACSHEEMLSWVDALSFHLNLAVQDTSPSPPPTQPRALEDRATLPRSGSQATTHAETRERSHSLQHCSSKRDQPLPDIPLSTELTLAAGPPLPQRPDELRYSKSLHPS